MEKSLINRKNKIDSLLLELEALQENFVLNRCSEASFDKNLTYILANLRKNFDNIDDQGVLSDYCDYLSGKHCSLMSLAYHELDLSLSNRNTTINSIDDEQDGLIQHIINVSNDLGINLDKDTAQKIIDFCISGVLIENHFDKSNFTDISNTVSKADIFRKLEEDHELFFSDAKRRKLYATMNKMRETILPGNTTDTKAKLTKFEARSLEIFILNEKDTYMKFLSKLNSNAKTVPKVPDIDDARVLKEKVMKYYEENTLQGDSVEVVEELETLFNLKLIEDTYHFDVLFLYTQLIDTLKNGILKTVVEAQSKGDFKNNIFLIILLQREIELAKQYVETVEVRLKNSINLISNLIYTEKNNILNESETSSLDSIKRMTDYVSNIDVGDNMSNNTFKEVITAFYGDEIDPNTFIK
ncbi:hypothetical protein M2901_05455 [Vagococcus lutrae]|uniref:hypothetical protein n=1 Tax=Vagococcus lutrae TaxID=81947 RepID=UPI00200DEDC1|nr:hypothetical protein [Vagococcus lutrae]UQF70236.1 hypothetical protein M2901_05455 [Vagococcus lutrae]